jgi:zinc protease
MRLVKYSLQIAMMAFALNTGMPRLAVAQELSAVLPVDPNVVTGKLDNGLTYYIRTNKKPENKVELRLAVKAGSILESKDQLGLAHFMEHMNFNGTKNFKKNDLVSYLQSIGVQFGADLNAYTAFDQTVYILPIPTDKPGNLEKGFQIIEDWAHNALLTDKDIDDERGVVLEESRLGKGADDRMLKKYFPKLAEGSLYADRLPIGKDEILKNFKYEQVRSFYKDWYRPDLQAVMIVGDIDVATAKKMLNDHFGQLKNPASEKARKYVEITPRKTPEAMVVTDKEATNAVSMLIFPYAKKPESRTIGDYRRDIVNNLAIQILNHRLGELSQGANPPYAYAGAGMDGMVHGYQSLSVFALIGSDGPEKGLNAMTGELLKAKKFGFTQSELDRAKKEMQGNIEKSYNERGTTDSKDYIEEYIRSFLDNEPIPGIANEYDYYKNYMPGITLAEVSAAAATWTKNMNYFSLITGPEKTDFKMPNDAQLLAMTEKGFKQTIAQNEDKKVAASLMETPPAPGKVISQVKEEGFEATTYTLSNGVKVTIKPTTFKSDEIIMKGIKKGGSNSYTVADRSNVKFATELMDAMGYGQYNPTEIEKILAGAKIEAQMVIGEINNELNCSSTIKDFETMLQLTYLQMMQPRKDADLFKAFVDKQKSMMQFVSANPQAAFSDTVVKTLYNNNPLARMVIPKASDFDKLKMDRAVEIYSNEFGSADGYHFFIVGNIESSIAIPLLETYLGSIPARNKAVSFKDNGVRPLPGNKELKFRKGKEKQSMILEVYTGEAKYSEDFALKARAVAEVLNIKVVEELREKMGAIYGGGFNAAVAKEPYERYSVQLYLPCGPENVDKLIAAANEEIKSLKEKGPDVKDVDKVKNQWLEKYKTDVKENKFWAEKMESSIFWGRERDRVLNYESYINKLTPAEIQDAAKKLFTGNNQFISVLYPEG